MADAAAKQQQSELAPVSPSDEKTLPELGQMIKQMFSNVSGMTFEIRTDQFGPYTPASVPLWVLKIMRRDPMLRLALRAIKGPMLKASRYYLRGGSDRVRGFVNKVLRPIMPKLLRTCLNALDFGFQAHEIVWDETLPTISYTNRDGTKEQVRRAVVPRRIADLDPDLVDVLVDRSSGKFVGLNVKDSLAWDPINLTGVVAAIGEARFLPPEKVLLCTNEMEFGNQRGTSILLPVYNPWWWGNVNDLLWGRFTERLGIGVYVGTAPSDMRVDRNGRKQDPIAYLMSILNALRAAGVAVVPFEAGPDGENKWKVELLETKHDGTIFEKRGQQLDAKKLRGLLIPDRLLTAAETGGYASQGVIIEQFFSWVSGIEEEVVIEPIIQQLIRLLVLYNFGANEEVPVMKSIPMSPASKKVYTETFKAICAQPRSLEKDDIGTVKRVENGSIVDAVQLLEAMDVPVLDEDEWPVMETLDLPPGLIIDAATGLPMQDPSTQPPADPANPKAGASGSKSGKKNTASKKKDVTLKDTEKNGAKDPTGARNKLA